MGGYVYISYGKAIKMSPPLMAEALLRGKHSVLIFLLLCGPCIFLLINSLWRPFRIIYQIRFNESLFTFFYMSI